MIKLTIPFLLTGGLLFLLASCELDSLSDVNYEPEFAFPLAQASFNIKDVLVQFRDSTILSVNPDGTLRLKYTGDVLTKTTDEVFASINESLGHDALVPLNMDTTVLPAAFPDGLSVDRMDLKAGDFYYTLQSKNPLPVHAEIKALSLQKDGEPLTYNVDIPAWESGGPITVSNLFFPADLNGYSIIPNSEGEILISKNIVDSNGDPVELELQAIVLQNLAYSYAEGYLGNVGYNQPRDTIEIDFFDSWIQGDIHFDEPVITMLFENSFGIPTRSIINTFEVFTVRGDVLPLESDFITDGVDFPYPSFDEIGQTKTAAFEFNKDNSTIVEILGAGPLALDYDVDALTNPDNDTSIIGFVTDSSYYKVQVAVDLPFYGSAINFLAEDTFDIDLSAFESATEAELKVITENSIPLGAKMQGYFLDESGRVLDSLFAEAQGVITPAGVNAEGYSAEVSSATTFVELPKDKFAGVKPAKQLIIAASFSTTAEGTIPVKITNDQDLSIRMGMRVKVQK